MLRILLFLGMTIISTVSTAYAQKDTTETEKFVCKDSSDPRCMTE